MVKYLYKGQLHLEGGLAVSLEKGIALLFMLDLGLLFYEELIHEAWEQPTAYSHIDNSKAA